MKDKIQIIIIIILIFILGIICYLYFKDDTSSNIDINNQIEFQIQSSDNETTVTETDTTVVSTTSEVTSGLTENIELHSTYYLEEIYVEEDEEVEEGDYILKYSNGTYLTAPYKCVINELNIPEIGEQCTNEHYIEISSLNILSIQIQVDESLISELSVGDEAEIEVTAIEENVTGNITNISNTASNGRFTVTVEFENSGNIKLGMTASIEI